MAWCLVKHRDNSSPVSVNSPVASIFLNPCSGQECVLFYVLSAAYGTVLRHRKNSVFMFASDSLNVFFFAPLSLHTSDISHSYQVFEYVLNLDAGESKFHFLEQEIKPIVMVEINFTAISSLLCLFWLQDLKGRNHRRDVNV